MPELDTKIDRTAETLIACSLPAAAGTAKMDPTAGQAILLLLRWSGTSRSMKKWKKSTSK